MTAALLLLTIAIADLAMLLWLTVRARPAANAAAVAIGVAWPVVLILGFAAGWAVALGFTLAGGLWTIALASRWSPRLVIPVGLLLAIVIAALLLVPSFSGLIQPTWTAAWNASGAVVSPAVATMVVAVFAFLAHSSNVIVRATLTLARRHDANSPTVPAVEPATTTGSWVIAGRWRWARVHVVPPEPMDPPLVSTMRGGRWIGPLERWAIVAVGLAGAVGVIAAIMAGKGIVRFPEISADRGVGSKAEEFLVGSLLSWSLAGCGIALIGGVATLSP